MRSKFIKYKGYILTENKKSMLFSAGSQTKEGVFLSNAQLKSMIIALQKLLDHYNNKKREYDDVEIEDYSSLQNSNEVFYRYISKYDLETFVKKGKFRLGTISHYQKIEDKNRIDEGEGFTHLVLESAKKQQTHSFYAGFHYLVFCGSYIPPSDTRAEYLLKKFGPCVLKIKNIYSFQRMIERHIQSKSTIYKKVKYSDLKALKYLCEQNFEMSDKGITDLETFNLIQNIISPNNIFKKTTDYSNEYELRFAFETIKDQKHPVRVDNKGLLDHIEIVKDK